MSKRPTKRNGKANGRTSRKAQSTAAQAKALTERITKEQHARIKHCNKAIQIVLKKHKCGMRAIPTMVAAGMSPDGHVLGANAAELELFVIQEPPPKE